jgi:hypothetical protein
MASYIDPSFRESLLKKPQDRTAQVSEYQQHEASFTFFDVAVLPLKTYILKFQLDRRQTLLQDGSSDSSDYFFFSSILRTKIFLC